MTDQVSSVQSALYKLGIATTDYKSNGKLTINEDTLKQALSDDPTKVAAIFTGDDGIASRLQTVINKHIGTTGIEGILVLKAGEVDSSSSDQSAIGDLVSDYDDKIKDLEDRLETQQEYYYSKFTALETYISQMNSQASWFSTSST
jgi:flagellar capping protein FliD